MGCEEPAISMDNGGKIIWAKHNNIKTANTKVNLGNINNNKIKTKYIIKS